MLTYLNSGARTTEKWPATENWTTRDVWAFVAVLEGEARLDRPGRKGCEYRSRQLHIVPPGTTYAMRVRDGTSCEVVAMHFAGLLPVAKRFLPGGTPLSVPITDEDAGVIRKIHLELSPHFLKPTWASELRYDRALLKLCLIALPDGGRVPHPYGADRSAEQAQVAVQYHRDHLAKRLTINKICKAIHISPPHLRRIFKQSFNESPKEVFTRVALDEASRLVISSPLSLKEIALQCGFAGFSQFFRAFKKRFGNSPSEWRRQRQPRPAL